MYAHVSVEYGLFTFRLQSLALMIEQTIDETRRKGICIGEDQRSVIKPRIVRRARIPPQHYSDSIPNVQ